MTGLLLRMFYSANSDTLTQNFSTKLSCENSYNQWNQFKSFQKLSENNQYLKTKWKKSIYSYFNHKNTKWFQFI